MLITNFASGELSENLFGRIDLPQYYQGVARLENFDVIPTGGISKRNGTRRILQLDEDGRLIPFILDREHHYLLYLTPLKIRIYLNGVLKSTVVSSPNLPLYATPDEINEVQYAQNFNMMVMVHENYPPINIYFNEGDTQQLFVSLFPVSYNVTINASDTIDTAPYAEDDAAYSATGYLKSVNNYPACVSFFQGRIVFGGTRNRRQRIFASKVNNYSNFSTYKKYLTENREYTSFLCTLETGSNRITLTDPTATLNLSSRIEDYIIDAPGYFPAGTRINAMSGTQAGSVLLATSPATVNSDLLPDEAAALDQLVNDFNNANEHKRFFNIGTGSVGPIPLSIHFRYGSSESNITTTLSNYENMDFLLPDNAATSVHYDATWLVNYIKEKANDISLSTLSLNDEVITAAAENWRNIILNTMQFNFRGAAYYNFAPIIKQQIIEFTQGGANIFLPMYVAKIIVERYPTPDDGFTFEIASDMSDAIRWIGQNKNLLIGTETAEWVVPAGTNATNVQAILNSRYGSDKVQATSVGDAMCFFQSGKKALVEYYIPQQDNNFRANNMAMLSKNMLHESPAFDFDFISAPYTKIFVSREDGVVVNLLYERSTGTFAWARISTSGRIESIATIPGQSGFDDVYLIVERQGQYYLELLQEREPVYLDSHKAWTGDAAGYTDFAVVYDETDNKVYPVTQPPIPEHTMWIGYPFTAIVRSMPILANDQMKPNNIKSLSIRFFDSFMPRMKSLPNNVENTITLPPPLKEPFTGVIQKPFPGGYDRDVHFELIHDTPSRCRILAVNAEAN